jgi:hypothetical protein
MQTKAPYDDKTSKKGDLYYKSGKNACMSSNLKTLHNCFWIVTGKILNEVQQDCEKKRSIALMITKNRFWSWNKKKMRWTLPLGKSQRNEKINLAIGKPRVFQPCDQELSGQPYNQEVSSFQTLRSRIIKKHQVSQPFSCHLFKTSPGKSYSFHTCHFTFFLSHVTNSARHRLVIFFVVRFALIGSLESPPSI